jgi:2-succinyl-6-hydroxy-2,4-cyclohexadiene-1-carboxylate synthase
MIKTTLMLNGLHYTVRRAGDGPPLLLLHGFTGTGDTWHLLWDDLAPDYTVIAPDLIGHGTTDAPADASRYAMPQAAADLIALLDALSLERVHLLGYSMGGRLALYMAVYHAERLHTLMLESASPGLRNAPDRVERRARDDALADRIERDGIPAFVDFWQGLPLWNSQQTTLSAEARAALRAERLRQRPSGLANSLRGMGTGVQPSLWRALPGLECPVSLIVGEADEKFRAINTAMQGDLPQARLHVIPDAGHTPHLENPAACLRVMREALSS